MGSPLYKSVEEVAERDFTDLTEDEDEKDEDEKDEDKFVYRRQPRTMA